MYTYIYIYKVIWMNVCLCDDVLEERYTVTVAK